MSVGKEVSTLFQWWSSVILEMGGETCKTSWFFSCFICLLLYLASGFSLTIFNFLFVFVYKSQSSCNAFFFSFCSVCFMWNLKNGSPFIESLGLTRSGAEGWTLNCNNFIYIHSWKRRQAKILFDSLVISKESKVVATDILPIDSPVFVFFFFVHCNWSWLSCCTDRSVFIYNPRKLAPGLVYVCQSTVPKGGTLPSAMFNLRVRVCVLYQYVVHTIPPHRYPLFGKSFSWWFWIEIVKTNGARGKGSAQEEMLHRRGRA